MCSLKLPNGFLSPVHRQASSGASWTTITPIRLIALDLGCYTEQQISLFLSLRAKTHDAPEDAASCSTRLGI